MLMERELEKKITDVLKGMSALADAEVVGSRQPAESGLVKGENETERKSVVAVAVGYRKHDAFTLSPVSVPVTVAITTRVEMDATGLAHEELLEAISDKVSEWHLDANAMSDALTTNGFYAGELRCDGGSGRQYDSTRAAWVETIEFTIRGAVQDLRN